MRGEKRSSIGQVERLLRQDEFNQHKCLYDLHAATWLVARNQNDEALLRKSARQMLFRLQKMYMLAKLKRSARPSTHPSARGSEAGFSGPGD